MKLFFLTLLVITQSAIAQKVVSLSGKITNPVSDTLEVFYNDNRIAYYPKEFFAPLDKDGNFSMTFPVPEGFYIQANIAHGNKSAELLLQAGDSLFMSADAVHFDSTIHFEGRGSVEANFIARHKLERGVINQYMLKVKTEINKEPADFLVAIEQEKKTELQFLHKYGAGLNPEFVKYWNAFFRYYNYFFIQQYPQIHEVIRHRKYTDTVPDVNYSVLADMPDAFNDSFLQVPSYLLYLTGVIEVRLKAAGFGNYLDPLGAKKLRDSVTHWAYKHMPDGSAEYFIAQGLYGGAKMLEPAKTEAQLKTYKKRWPHSNYLPAIESQLLMAKRLAKGQPAPDFTFTTSDGRRMKLSDLKGKVVYLQFWAGWCKQCISEMAAENRIKPLLKNKPVEFLYVSIASDTTADKNIIEKLRMQGLFANIKNGWYANEIKQYGVQSLPAYFLIDKQGKFAMQNCPTPPQSTMLLLEIGKLLK